MLSGSSDTPARICAVGGAPTGGSIEGFAKELFQHGYRRYPFAATLDQQSESLGGPSDRACPLMIWVNKLSKASLITSGGAPGLAPIPLKLLPARDCLSAICKESINRPVAIIGLPRQSLIC